MLPLGVATRRSPWMTEELSALRDLARSFCAKEIAPYRAHWEETGQVDRELWHRAGAVGLLCLSVPEQYGGGGGGIAHEAIIHEERARVGDTGWGVGVHNSVAAHYLSAYGTQEQRRRWLPRMATGDLVAAIAMTEPGAGSDLKGIRTAAVRHGDHYVVDGSKTFITNGRQADLIIVVVRTRPGTDRSGLSLLVVETAQAAGFSRGPALAKVGMKAQDTCPLFFDGVRVAADNLLGGVEGQAFAQMMQQLPRERLVVAIDCVAVMEQALASTVEYVKQRTAFDRELIRFQNTRMKLAEAATEVTVTRTFIDECIQRFDSGALDDATASMAKWWASDRLGRVVDECVQLFGGYGYMTEYPIARAFADARVQRIFGGTNELMKELIARSL
ncbi:acyl-CoA dehydrogenase family protein [Streptomyces sp. NBC_01485]|uniref:acyl-CoA dehydrogenase family protein n=1 Tax=Streptomyces sp. NBC_01485 TaxID=2903884 RepID=UPI002E30B2CE|nr:acyl-CoA dehydrogenase family protein [Streptomyces sp. NBC_01485]